jgi:hypothetical protein
VELARDTNDALGEAIAKQPTRLSGFATLPIAAPELERRLGWMQIDRRAQRFGGLQHRPEKCVVQIATALMTVDHRTGEGLIAEACQPKPGPASISVTNGAKPPNEASITGSGGESAVPVRRWPY